MALLDNGRGAFCPINTIRNLNITCFVNALRRPSGRILFRGVVRTGAGAALHTQQFSHVLDPYHRNPIFCLWANVYHLLRLGPLPCF